MDYEHFPIACFETVLEGTEFRKSAEDEWQPAEEGIELFDGAEVRNREQDALYAINLMERCEAEFAYRETEIDVDECRYAEFMEADDDEWQEVDQHSSFYCAQMRVHAKGFAEIETREAAKLSLNEELS